MSVTMTTESDALFVGLTAIRKRYWDEITPRRAQLLLEMRRESENLQRAAELRREIDELNRENNALIERFVFLNADYQEAIDNWASPDERSSSMSLAQETIGYSKAFRAQLLAELDTAQQRHAEIIRESAALAFAKHTGVAGAAKKLALLDGERAQLAVDMEHLRDAIAEAGRRVADDDRQAAINAEVQRQRACAERFDRVRELAVGYDNADPTTPPAAKLFDALSRAVLNMAAESRAPSAQAVNVGLDRLHRSRLRGTKLEERDPFRPPFGLKATPLIDGWRSMLLRSPVPSMDSPSVQHSEVA